MDAPDLPIDHPLAPPEAVGLDSSRLSRISDWMRRYVDEGKLPGMLAMVARRDKVVFMDWCGSRDVEQQLPMEHDTVVRIYSMTKPITTVAALMLSAEPEAGNPHPVATGRMPRST